MTATSNDRGMVIADRGVVTAIVPDDFSSLDTQISGPYVLLGSQVYRSDGRLLYTERPGVGEDSDTARLFGRTIIEARVNTGASSGSIWLDDVETPHPRLLARFRAGRAGSECGYGNDVVIWGSTAGWVTCDLRHLVLLNLNNGKAANGGARFGPRRGRPRGPAE